MTILPRRSPLWLALVALVGCTTPDPAPDGAGAPTRGAAEAPPRAEAPPPRWREMLEEVPDGEPYPRDAVEAQLNELAASITEDRLGARRSLPGVADRDAVGDVIPGEPSVLDPRGSLAAVPVRSGSRAPRRWTIRDVDAARTLVDGLDSHLPPVWLPGGDLLLTPDPFRLERMAFTSGRRTPVWTVEGGARIEDVVASESGDRVLVRTDGGGRPSQVWRIDLEGGPARPIEVLDPSARPLAATGRLDVFEVSGDGGSAVVTLDRTRPGARPTTVLELVERDLVTVSPTGWLLTASMGRPAETPGAMPFVTHVELHGLDGRPRARVSFENAGVDAGDPLGGGRFDAFVRGRRAAADHVLEVDAGGELVQRTLWRPPVPLIWSVHAGTSRGTPGSEEFDPRAPTVRDPSMARSMDHGSGYATWAALGGQFEFDAESYSRPSPSSLAEPPPAIPILVDALEAARLRPRADLLERLRARGEL